MRKLIVCAAAVTACAMSSGAAAQAYASVAAGRGVIKVDCAGASTCDSSDDPAYRFIAGHRFLNGLAVELGITDYGTASYHGVGTYATVMTNGISAGLAFDAPVNSSFGFISRAGITQLKTEVEISTTFLPVRRTGKNIAPYVGLGLYVMPWRNIRVEAGVDLSRAEVSGEKIDLRALLVGVRLLF